MHTHTHTFQLLCETFDLLVELVQLLPAVLPLLPEGGQVGAEGRELHLVLLVRPILLLPRGLQLLLLTSLGA